MALVRVEELKTELQSLGVRILPEAGGGGRIREGGAGPAEGVTLVLDGTPASVPTLSGFVSASPFRLEEIRGRWGLFRGEERIDLPVELPPQPAFYRKSTAEGVPYPKIALMHGVDCLASTVLQACSYWGTGSACQFCGIGLSWKAGKTLLKKESGLLADAAREAKESGARHVTLTAGSTKKRRTEWELFREAARAIRQAAGLPVHVQVMPPITTHQMKLLREDGVASIGIHLESFDPAVLRGLAPYKASIPLDEYVRAWEEAVTVFGWNQVSSFLLMGLGESSESVLEGCERLASIGVYPYLVPFRPIPGTPLAHLKPLRPEPAKEIYRGAAQILEGHGLHWRVVRAGCVRCRGCSALPDFQDALALRREEQESPEMFSWEVTERGPLLEASYAIRHEVFVKEQGLFRRTDRDEMDSVSVHILALRGEECVGTVRITPLNGGDWLGSRLAVREPFRGRVGNLLVERAEEEVRKRGGRRFRAYIQSSKVAFFERCGWRPLKRIPDYHGRPHVLMLAAGPLWGPGPPAPFSEDAGTDLPEWQHPRTRTEIGSPGEGPAA
jgi:radical SAM protein (TIGR04043 family)/putative N-acetyltransferase (TIGR04045 family)